LVISVALILIILIYYLFEKGINLIGQEAAGKLVAINSANAMCSHKIYLSDVNDIDDEVIQWIRTAYNNAG